MIDQANETRQRFPDRLAAATRPLLAVWERVTRPAAAIQQRDAQRRARLLSALLLVVIGVGLLLVLMWELFNAPADPFWRSDFFLETGTLVLLVAIYRLSRTRRYTLAAVLTIGVITGAIFAVAASTHDPERVNLLAYLLVPVVACTLLLSLQVAALLIVFNLVGMLLFAALSGGESLWNPWIGFTFLISIAILLTTYYHSLLGKDRRAALRESEEKFRLIFENAFDGISIHEDILLDESHRIRRLLDCNARYAEMAGRSKEELLHVNDTLAIQRGTGPLRSIEQEIVLLREEQPHQGFFSWIRPDGRENVIEYRAQPIQIGDKTLTIGLDRDITERARAENALRESEERYRLLVESADAAISIVTWDGTFLFMNSVAAKSLGGKPEDFVGTATLFDLFPPETAEHHMAAIRRVIESGQGTVSEAPTVLLGESHWYRTSLKPIRDAAGNITSALVIAYDFTERKNAEDALRESEERYRLLVESADAAISTVNRDGTFLFMNGMAARSLGGEPQNFVGQTVFDLFPPVVAERHMAAIRRVIESGQGTVIEAPTVVAGEPRWYRTSLQPIRDSAGTVTAALVISYDITERKDAESALLQSEMRFRELFNSMSSGVVVYEPSPDGSGLLIKDMNEASQRTSRVKKEEIIGKDVREVFPGVEALGLWGVFRRVQETGLPAHHPTSLYQDGRLSAWVENRIYKLPSGEIIAVYDDVTEHKLAEEALRRHDAILEAAAFSAERFLTVPDWEQSIQEVLERIGQAAGVERVYIFENERASDGTLLTSQRFEWAAPGVPSQVDDPRFQAIPWQASGFGRWEKTLSRGEAIVGHVRTFPPSEQAVLSSQGILSLLDVPIFAGQHWWGYIGFDDCRAEREWTGPEIEAVTVTASTLGAAIQRQRAEAALRESEERFRSIVEQSHDGVALTNQNGVLVEWNRAAGEITGLGRDEVLGYYLWDMQLALRPEGERTPELYERIRRAMLDFLQATPLSSLGRSEECDIRCPDGTRKIVQVVTFPIKQGDGFMACSILRDVTEQKRAQDQRLRLSVEQEKVKLLSNFVRDVSHEFRMPLSVIYTGLEVLERAAALDDASVQRVGVIKAQALYIADLVDAMLMMARLDSDPQFAFSPIDLSVLARDVGIEMETLLQKKAQTLTLDLAEGLPVVRADAGKLHRALVNLCKNAIQFTPDMGSITLRTYARGEYAVIEVADTGIGLDEHDLPHIFERFYRADQARTERHAGLGLSIAHKIVEAHRGRIEVESTPGQGCTFRMVLPVVGE
jgi:PAS domain S-box-containing protein